MAAGRIVIAFDDLTDVVSAYRRGTRAATVASAPADRHVLLEFDEQGQVVGIEMQGASVLVPAFWTHHPDRHMIPSEILNELDDWLQEHWNAR